MAAMASMKHVSSLIMATKSEKKLTDGVGHGWAIWRLLIRVVVKIKLSVACRVVVLVIVERICKQNDVRLLDLHAVVHFLVFERDANIRLRELNVLGHIPPQFVDWLPLIPV